MAGSIWATDADGANFKTKKALREAVAAGERVTYLDTSTNVVLPASAIRPSDVIVGPNPYTKRDWYANLNSNGRIK